MNQLNIFTSPPKRAYFNTTRANGDTLVKRNAKASSQNALILSFFQERTGEDFTAWEVSRHFLNYPITSIRRSLNTLERDGKLYRNGMRNGDYGRENFIYKLKLNPQTK